MENVSRGGKREALAGNSSHDFLVFLGDSVLSGPQPKETAEILRKYGGYIPGIRPGERSAEYIESILI